MVLSSYAFGENFSFEGRTEQGNKKCSFEVEGYQIRSYEYRKSFRGNRDVAQKKIVIESYDSKAVGIEANGNKFFHYISKKQPNFLVKEFSDFYLYFNDEGIPTRALALLKSIPVFGNTTHQLISCINR